MKYAIMSDAHANPAALMKVVDDAKGQACGRFVFLGDAVGYGYDAKSTVDVLRTQFDVVLRGNHDVACRKTLAREDAEWLRSRAHRHDGDGFSCIHGDFIAPQDRVSIVGDLGVGDLGAWYAFRTKRARVSFSGHTHHACVWEEGADGNLARLFDMYCESVPIEPESWTVTLRPQGRYVVNCGSVGYPRNDLCSTYAIYDEDMGKITIRRIPFDFAGYVGEMLSFGNLLLPRWLVEYSLCCTGRYSQRGGAVSSRPLDSSMHFPSPSSSRRP